MTSLYISNCARTKNSLDYALWNVHILHGDQLTQFCQTVDILNLAAEF